MRKGVSKKQRLASDNTRVVAFWALRRINGKDGFANLVLSDALHHANLSPRDSAFVTNLVSTATRWKGTFDAVIEVAAQRNLAAIQPSLLDVLRLGVAQWWLEVPQHATVSETVALAGSVIGERVVGITNAVLRRVTEKTSSQWLETLSSGLEPMAAKALRFAHPSWIVAAFAESLPDDELEIALEANNVAPSVTLVARPGLITRDELIREVGGVPTQYSPYGVHRCGNPAEVAAVRSSHAGVQDEGSQLVTLAAVRAADLYAATGAWLDMCAGPGGKAALLAGLAQERNQVLLANELQYHRAKLVAQTLHCYSNHLVIAADARTTPWRDAAFALALLDAPCSGLGALRRRPDARWQRSPEQFNELNALQRALLAAAVRASAPGGIIAWITCSPHPSETVEIVQDGVSRYGLQILDAPALLPEVPNSAALSDLRFIQLWPHRHGTDAMFCALLKVATP
ncbi:MAG: rRNA cytosine-C5-methylase [Propionibacteriaceae bacterium]|nr:rRNA cytosine-C5-methylase [Propionibacteriaceae bacterium]